MLRAAERELDGAFRVCVGETFGNRAKLIRPWSSGFALAPAPAPAERKKRAAAVILDNAAE